MIDLIVCMYSDVVDPSCEVCIKVERRVNILVFYRFANVTSSLVQDSDAVVDEDVRGAIFYSQRCLRSLKN